MTDIDDGYYFWKRVDAARPKTMTLKHVVEEAGLNYHLVKVQRSCNRIPKAIEAAKLAAALEVSLEWLITGKLCDAQSSVDLLDPQVRRQMSRIISLLICTDLQRWPSVESVLRAQSHGEQYRTGTLDLP